MGMATSAFERKDSMAGTKLNFASDYTRGAHPEILKRFVDTNMMKSAGYGSDEISESAREKIRKACGCRDACVQFLLGGTQANATVIDAFLRSYQGVIAAETGHISAHEAGAIETAGHKVLTMPGVDAKLRADDVRRYMENFCHDDNRDHMVQPAMVYISQPTEHGTLYTREELKELHEVCARYGLSLYADGARLAYALACPENDVTLKDLAAYCDAFYIGGTKCGALFGEAVVIPDPKRIPGFFTIIKQHGALMAKGRLLGLQFDTMFTDGLYERIGIPAIREAQRIREALVQKGYELCFGSPTNQVFCVMKNSRLEELGREVEYSFWEKFDDTHTVVRFATDWSTTPEETDALISIL